MTRKLHNTLMALVASSSLLTLSLITGTPVAPSMHEVAAQASIARLDDAPVVHRGSTENGNAASAPAHGQPKSSRVRRQSLALPFFSFAPRG